MTNYITPLMHFMNFAQLTERLPPEDFGNAHSYFITKVKTYHDHDDAPLIIIKGIGDEEFACSPGGIGTSDEAAYDLVPNNKLPDDNTGREAEEGPHEDIDVTVSGLSD